MKKTFDWSQAENIAVKNAAQKCGLSDKDFIREACAEKVDRLNQASALEEIKREIQELRQEFTSERAALLGRISGAHEALSKQLNRGLAGELDMHLRAQLDVLSRFGETGKVFPPGKNPTRIDGMDLPTVIQKPSTK